MRELLETRPLLPYIIGEPTTGLLVAGPARRYPGM